MINFLFIIIVILNLIFFYYHKNLSNFFNIYDYPDYKRKLHTQKIPLSGGILVFFNLSICSIYLLLQNIELSFFFKNKLELLIFYLTSMMIFCLGLYDDKKNLSPNLKIFLISIILLPSIIFIENNLINEVRLSFLEFKINIRNFSYIWTLLCFLLFINSVNMFDGINLQVALYKIFLTLILFLAVGVDYILIFLLPALITFSFLNYKSKSFLGDSGSLLLSYIFGSFFIITYNEFQDFYADKIVLLMIIPGIDLMRLFVTRYLNNRKPFYPDKNHLHHILLKRFSLNKVIIFIQVMIILPFILESIFGGTIIFIFLSIILYFIILKKNS